MVEVEETRLQFRPKRGARSFNPNHHIAGIDKFISSLVTLYIFEAIHYLL